MAGQFILKLLITLHSFKIKKPPFFNGGNKLKKNVNYFVKVVVIIATVSTDTESVKITGVDTVAVSTAVVSSTGADDVQAVNNTKEAMIVKMFFM